MVDDETTEQGVIALAVAICSIMEDHAPEAARRPGPGPASFRDLANTLETAGADIAVLAAAMKVLIRQNGSSN